MTLKPDPLAYPPRGMNRDEAARYIGVSTTLFEEMVADGRMPRAKQIGRRTVWDKAQIDMAFTALPEQESYVDQMRRQAREKAARSA